MTEEDQTSAALLEFLNACEAGIVAAKRLIAENKYITEGAKWNPTNIRWVLAEGNRGPYERSQDSASPDFKSLLEDLSQHGGRLAKDGYFFWIFQDGTTVGRKKSKNAKR